MLTRTLTEDHPTIDVQRPPSFVKAITAGTIGNAIEWFDWSVYAAFSLYFAPKFFPSSDPTTSLLATLAVFAVGFGMRPVGALVIGIYADKVGRRAALVLTILMMSIPSFVIGVLPTYENIGIFAPILLVFARLVQGLAVGGEYGAAATFIAESAPPERRGFYSGFMFFSLALGTLLASSLAWLLPNVLTATQMGDYGWRLPFFIGGFGGLVAVWLRRGVAETEAFSKKSSSTGQVSKLKLMLRDHPGAFRRMVGITILGATAFYFFVSYLPIFAIRHNGATASVAFGANSVALIIYMFCQPLFGAISDRFGRRPQLIVFALGYLLFAYPVVLALDSSFSRIFLVELFGMLLYGLYSSIAPAVKSEIFSTDVRAMGIGLPYNLVVAIFGGTTPYLITLLESYHREELYFIYLAVIALIGLITYIRMPETRGKSLNN